MKLNEEDPRVTEDNVNEEGNPVPKPSTQEMTKTSSWVHQQPAILNQGRTKHADPRPGKYPESMEPEEQVAAEIKEDPFTPRLKPIIKDDKTKGGMPAWVSKSYNMDSNGTVVLKSIWWKGFYAFY